MNKGIKHNITPSLKGTRIYFFLLTIINFIWLYCMDVQINFFSIISACVVFLILFLLFRKYGTEYVLSVVSSNLFFSLFFLVFPFSFLVMVAAQAKEFFLQNFIIGGSFGSASIFIFSALSGLIISFFPYREGAFPSKIKFWTRLKIILIMFLILLMFYFFYSVLNQIFKGRIF